MNEKNDKKEDPVNGVIKETNLVRLITMGLIVLSGLGNFAATKHADVTVDQRIQQGMDRINALYEKLQADRAKQSTVDKLISQIDEMHAQLGIMKQHQDELYYKWIIDEREMEKRIQEMKEKNKGGSDGGGINGIPGGIYKGK